jgi:hypothetical protein
MEAIKLTLDVVDGDEGLGNLDEQLGQVDTGYGMAVVTLVTRKGPAGGWPVVTVEGPPPVVLAWLVDTYRSTLEEALELLDDAVPAA